MDFEKIEEHLRAAELREPSAQADNRIRAALGAAQRRSGDRTVFYLAALAAVALVSLLVFMNVGGDTAQHPAVDRSGGPAFEKHMAADDEEVSEKAELSDCYLCIAKDGVLIAEPDFSKGRFVEFPKELAESRQRHLRVPARGYFQTVRAQGKVWLFEDVGEGGLWSLGLTRQGWRASFTEGFRAQSIQWNETDGFTSTSYDYENEPIGWGEHEYREKKWKGTVGADGKLKWEVLSTSELRRSSTAEILLPARIADGEQEFVLADRRIVTIGGASATCFLYRGISGGKLRVTWSKNCDHEETLAEFEFGDGERPSGDLGDCKFLQLDIKDDLTFTCTLAAAAFQGWEESGGMSMGKYHTYIHRTTDSGRTWATVLDDVWQGRDLLDCVKLD